MPDEIIEELWRIEDDIAREHSNDVRKLAVHLQDGESQGRSPDALRRSVVDVAAEAPGD